MSIDLARELEELKKIVEGHGQDLRVFNQLARTQLRGERLSRVGVGPGVRSLDPRVPREPSVGHGSDQAFDISAADTLGNVRAFIGQTNMLEDPTFESVGASRFLTTSALTSGRWNALYVLNSGTAPTDRYLQRSTVYHRGHPGNPFSSAMAIFNAFTFNTAAANIDFYVYPTTDFLPTLTTLPWLVAAVRPLIHAPSAAKVTVANLTLEIYNATTSTVVASSETFDVKNGPQYETRQLVAAVQKTPAEFKAAAWRWRLKYHVEVPASAVAADGTTIYFGEPQFHFSYTPDPVPYAPQVAGWLQGIIARDFALTGELSPPPITANTNDYNPDGLAGSSVLRLSTDASRNLTGIVSLSDSGVVYLLQNVGSNNLVLVHDATSALANRFYLPGNANYTLSPGASAFVHYDELSTRWRVTGSVGGGVAAVAGPAKYAANVGDGVSVTILVVHNLGTEDVLVGVRNVLDDEVGCDVNITSVNTITLGFTVAPASNSLRCVVIG